MHSKYSNLDVLRSLAVLSVVVQHFWRQCYFFHFIGFSPFINQLVGNLSFTGVMFFFVHTCLVLMMSLERGPSEHMVRSFLIRRAFRIFPLCWTAIVLALATGLTDQGGANAASLGWQGVLANFALVQNVANKFPSAIGPLWSLPWEVQMYMVLPILFLFLRKFSKIRVVFALWAGATLLAAAVIRPGLPRMFHAALYPPMFIGGMVAYKLLARLKDEPRARQLPAWAWPLFVIALFALQALLVGGNEFESTRGILCDSLVCVILAIAIPVFSDGTNIWLAVPAQQLAKYSYGVYLLHVPALILVLRYLPGLPLALKCLVFLVLTAAMSFVSYHSIEEPLIRLGKRLTTASRLSPMPSYVESGEAA
jgi:peptidoglycan/LPS O-acetylase OafA/YrhL